MSGAKNVLGGPLKVCCMNPKTGFYRTGRCDTGAGDDGVRDLRWPVSRRSFSNSAASEATTWRRRFRVPGFPGLKAGDRWCLCSARWKEALGGRRGSRRCT